MKNLKNEIILYLNVNIDKGCDYTISIIIKYDGRYKINTIEYS